MTPRNLLNLGILLAVIVLAVIAFYPRQQIEPTTPKVALLAVAKADVQTISIQGSGRPEMRFTRQDPQWRMTVPVQVSADEHRLSTLLNILDQPADRKLPVDNTNLSKYGLDTPLFTIRFNDLPLSIGATDPIHQRRYVMAQNAVFLVEDTFSRWLGEGAGAFIDSALLPPGSVIQKIQSPDFEINKTDTQWQYKPANPSAAADTHYSPDSLQTFIDEWRYGRALQVSLLSAPYKHSHGRQFTVYLQGRADPVVFYEESTAEDTAFVRADLQLRYHLTKDTVLRLSKIIEQKDTEPEPEPDEEPANQPAAPFAT